MFIRCHLDLANIDYNKIILYGMHVGHSFLNSVFYTAWLVYTYTQNILIINLFKTLRGFRSGLTSIIAAVNTYNPIWFINLDQAASISIKFLAISCGEFSATSFWINGFISNYISIYNTYYKLRKISWFAYPTRNKNVSDSYNFWYFTRCTWPRTSFISNVSCSYQPAKESSYLGIPCLGIVDTNTYTHVVSIPIPGSDDSIDCLVFYNSYISKFILLRKNNLILYWYFNTRKIKRISSFKYWLRKMKHLKFNNVNFNKRNLKLMSNIKFSFNLLKNINLGMKILFSQNLKYKLKNFEYLDIFKYYKRHNYKGIASIILKKKNMYRMFRGFYSYLKALKKVYLNKKLWSIYYIVRKRFFKQKYFQFSLFTKNYFKTNIKFDRFFKTHLRWNTINNIFSAKLYKFFIIYKFLQFKKLSTIIFNKQLLDSVFLKLIISQVFSTNNNFFINSNKNKIEYKKNFNLFYFKNFYKFNKIKQKKILLTNLFLLVNRKNWKKFSKYNRKNYIRKVKFLAFFSKIRKKIFIKKFSRFFRFLLKKKFKFIKKKFNKFKFFSIYLNFFKNLNILYKKYSKQFSKSLSRKKKFFKKIYKKRIYFKRKVYKKYLRYSKYFRFLFIKKIKTIKYNLYIHKFLFFIKNLLNNINWNKYKKIIYLFINIFFVNKRYVSNFFYNFFKKIIFNIFWLYILPNIKYNVLIKKKKKNLWYRIAKKDKKFKYKNFKYKQLFEKNINITNIIKLKKNNMPINHKFKKINIYNLIFLFLRNINYKKFNSIISKKKKIRYYERIRYSSVNELLKKLDNFNIFKKKKINLLHKHFNKRKKKFKTVSFKSRYCLYNIWLFKHPFFNIIKYEYFLYLKNNPYFINSNNYYSYLNYNNFIKWKRKNLINNLNWRIFIRYSSTNQAELYKDLFIRYKILYLKKSLYKDFFINSLFSLLDKKKVFKKYKYYLGWFNFNKSVKLKDWFYQKDFFLFPTWFYNYKKKKNYKIKIGLKKNIYNKNYELIRKRILKRNKIRFLILKFILKSTLYFFKKKKKKIKFTSKLKYNSFTIFRYNIKTLIIKNIFDYASIFWDLDYSKKVKNYMLAMKTLQLHQLFSLRAKKYFVKKIRFDRRIHNWNIKKNKINVAQFNILSSLSDKDKIKVELEVLKKRKWYTKFMKKKKIRKYRRFWKARSKYDLKSIQYILDYDNVKTVKDDLLKKKEEEKKNKIKLLKQNDISKFFSKNSILFKKKYNHIFLNNFKIGSSLNNLFYKFYNIPRFLFFKQIKIYLKNYKILIRNWNYKKNYKVLFKKKNFNHLKLLNKNFNNNLIINLSKFIRMYGFRWW